MKKLMTILVVFALCGVAMAYEPYNLKMETDNWGRQQKTTYVYTNGEGTTGLTYTVEKSKTFGNGQPDANGVNYQRYTGQVYFTTTTAVPEGKTLAVQFLGAEVEKGNASYDWWGNPTNGYDPNYRVKDYGIYLYNPETGERTSDYLSVQNYSNYFGEEAGVKAGTSFGVYFVDKDGNYIASTGDGGHWSKRYSDVFKNEENGIVGNFDDNNHTLTVYNPETGKKEEKVTDKHFLCLSAGEYGYYSSFNQTHWEFMLQTTLDNPYFPVNPNDFNDDVHVDDPVVDGVTGQPLPGTLATLLIGGLCAGSLRKRNKKH